MKLHDFGLWFYRGSVNEWSQTLPQDENFIIYYDGVYLGNKNGHIIHINDSKPYIITFKQNFYKCDGDDCSYCYTGTALSVDDFEVVRNPMGFGLWFETWKSDSKCRGWSTTIPPQPGFTIYYDGFEMAYYHPNFSLKTLLSVIRGRKPYLFKIKRHPRGIGSDSNSPLTLQDFEIIPNINYKE
jgi:hypothetical protein